MRRFAPLVLLLVPASLPAQAAACAHGPADAELTVSVPIKQPRADLEAQTDSLMTALGYTRAAPPVAEAYYRSEPRSGWPLGAAQAPWHATTDEPPGWVLSLRFEPQGAETTAWVTVHPLCAIKSTKKSRGNRTPEHMLALFGAMQAVTALSGNLQTALDPYAK